MSQQKGAKYKLSFKKIHNLIVLDNPLTLEENSQTHSLVRKEMINSLQGNFETEKTMAK